MTRLAFLVLSIVLVGDFAADAQEAAIKAKLDAAKQIFEKESVVAHQTLSAILKQKKSEAQQTGNLELVEKLMSEEKVFDSNDDLPRSMPTRAYSDAVKGARAKMEEAYVAARKAYTQAGPGAIPARTEQAGCRLTMSRGSRRLAIDCRSVGPDASLRHRGRRDSPT